MCISAEDYIKFKSMSLIERKKQQWAKEREELARLNPSTWGGGDTNLKYYNRSLYGSNNKLSTGSGRTTNRSNFNENDRRGSLPPLYKNQFNSANNNYDRDRGGETSGYGSDNPTPESSHTQWRQNNHQSGYESSSSYRDDRPKWGDKGVGVGKFWQPKEESLDKMATSEPPNWVKRGLQDGEILVSNSSPAVSPEQQYDKQENERPCTSSTFSRSSNKLTFIRGQNLPLDAVELAERERKRQIAMAHQEAIRQQLEERERKRLEERERRIREENEEELRIEREQQYERQRRAEEERLFQEKLERERRRKEAIQEAVELAEKEAKLEKMRLRMLKQKSNILSNNIAENVVEKEKVTESVIIEVKNDTTNSNVPSEKNTNCEQQQHNKKPVLNDTPATSNSIEINNDLPENPTTYSTLRSATPRENKVSLNNTNTRSLTPTVPNNTTPRNSITDASNNIAFLLDSLPNLNLQYALILPNMNTGVAQIPIAVPLNVPQSARSVVSTSRTENRVLTPSQYRTGKNTCDSSTQTDNSLLVVEEESINKEHDHRYYSREKLTNLELTYDNRRSKERRRSRSESVGDRPKWNANRPPTRYLKQSEKDPLYQRRKMRQKNRDDEKNSSDDSQIGSPRYNSGRNTGKGHHSRATWRKNDQVFTRNIRMYQTEIVPLETDKEQLYYKCCCTCKCQRHKCGDNIKVDMLKIEEISPRQNVEYRAEVVQRDVLPELRNSDNRSKVDILDKLSSLHNGLLMEQEKWENSPRTPAEY